MHIPDQVHCGVYGKLFFLWSYEAFWIHIAVKYCRCMNTASPGLLNLLNILYVQLNSTGANILFSTRGRHFHRVRGNSGREHTLKDNMVLWFTLDDQLQLGKLDIHSELPSWTYNSDILSGWSYSWGYIVLYVCACVLQVIGCGNKDWL